MRPSPQTMSPFGTPTRSESISGIASTFNSSFGNIKQSTSGYIQNCGYQGLNQNELNRVI